MAISRKKYTDMEFYNQDFESNRLDTINEAKKTLGFNFLKDYHVPDDYDFNEIPESYFINPYKQSIPMPFSNKQFVEFLRSEKYLACEPKIIKSKGALYLGVTLKSKSNNLLKPNTQDCYTLEIRRDSHYCKNKFFDFSISLELLVGGYNPLTLLRFDSAGSPHPMVYDENNKLLPLEDVIMVETPHLHLNSTENQVLSREDPQYLGAIPVGNQLLLHKNNKEPIFFEKALEFIVELCHINAHINNKSKYVYFDYDNLLFDYSDDFSYPQDSKKYSKFTLETNKPGLLKSNNNEFENVNNEKQSTIKDSEKQSIVSTDKKLNTLNLIRAKSKLKGNKDDLSRMC